MSSKPKRLLGIYLFTGSVFWFSEVFGCSSEAVQNDQVVVECFVLPSSTGMSKLQLQFSRTTVPVFQSQAQVQFTLVQTGSSVSVFCRAESFQCAGLNESQIVVTSSTAMTSVRSTASLSGNSTNSTSFSPKKVNSTLSSINVVSIFTSSTSQTGVSTTILSSVSPTTSPAPGVSSTTFQPTCQYLFETSTGPPVTFTIEVPRITAYPASADFQNLRKHVSFIALDKPLQESEDVELNCAIRAINISQLTEPICNSASGLPVMGASEVSVSGTIMKLLENKITFKTNEYYKNITVLISQVRNITFSQLYHSYCCVRNGSTRYRGESVSVFLWLDMKGSRVFSWTAVPTLAQQKITGVTILDFSCPCNLLSEVCDVNCCCDKDCSLLEIQAFVCIEGYFGGRPSKTFEFDCEAAWPDSTDWQPVLCVATNNSPFIGYLFKYTSPALASSNSEFSQLSQGRTRYSYEETEVRTSTSSNKRGYEHGMPIKTNIGTLSIPRNIFGGTTCMFSPIHYLQDTSATCLYEATSSACNEPTLNALNYLMLHDLVSPSCPNIPRILNENAGTSFSPLTVEYYCLKNNTDYFISNILQKKDEEIITESLFASSPSAKVLSERCSFDDAKTRPPSPVFSNLTNTCDNVVLDVNYKFSWNALQIQSILAKITLGSFPISTIKETISTYSFPITLIVTPTASPSSVVSAEISYFRSSSALAFAQPSSPNSTSSSVIQPSPPVLSASLGFQSSVVAPAPQFLTVVTFSSTVITRNVTIVPTVIQQYTVGFGHVSVQQQSYSINGSVSVLVSRAVVTSNNETTLTRSGNPGYVLGRPLMTQTSTEILSNISSTSGLTLWKSTGTGLCTTATKVPIPFGKDSVSGCIVYLGVDAFSNCSTLRDIVKRNQDDLVKAVRVGKRGNASPVTTTDWVNVIRIEPDMSTEASTAVEGTCEKVPAHLKIEVLVAEAGKYAGQSQMEISGVRMSYGLKTWKLKCFSGQYANCINKTVADSKLQTPVYRPFTVTSSVVFIRIPAVEPPRTKRSAKTATVCIYDTCWSELLYPLRNVYDAGLDFNLSIKMTQSSTAMAVTLIFLVFGAVFVTRPWR